MRLPRTFSLVAFSCVVTIGLAIRFGCTPTPPEHDFIDALTQAIRVDAKSLLACAAALRSGAMCEHPELLAGGRVGAVTIDDNKNVYFILRDSFVTFNVGFVARQDRSKLLGDGQEPEIRYIEHLFDDWWYYKAS